MDRGVDPSPSLRKQDLPRLGRYSVSDGVWTKFRLERWEVLHDECRQKTILSEREEILFVQSVNVGLGILVDDQRGDDDWTTFVRRSDTVDRETTG